MHCVACASYEMDRTADKIAHGINEWRRNRHRVKVKRKKEKVYKFKSNTINII